jgi:glutamyl-tRNA synthetase
MSKRSGAVNIKEYQEMGYLPEALINFLALLGWAPGDNQEIFTREELIKKFEIEKVGKSASIFDKEKLDFLNGYYIRQKSPEELLKISQPYLQKEWLKDSDFIKKVLKTVQERLKKLSELPELVDFYFKEPEYGTKLLIFAKSDQKRTKRCLQEALYSLKEAKEQVWQDQDKLNKLLAEVVKKHQLDNGDVFWPARVALSGKEASPSPAEILWVLGKEESLNRIKRALTKL